MIRRGQGDIARGSHTLSGRSTSLGETWTLILLAVAAAGFWAWFRLYTGICLEDALITYRYAENLASGRGFVFNEGQRVLGTTTPLLTLTLAACGRILGPAWIPLSSNVLMMLAGLGAGLSAHAAMRHLGFARLPSTACLLLLYAHPAMVWTTAGGMETPLVVFLMFLSLAALLTERLTLATVTSSLLVLTRIDGLIWACLIDLSVVLKRRKLLSRPVLVGLLIPLPWIVFSLIYFGSPIPNSLLAKHAIRHVDLASTTAAIKIYVPWFLESIGAPSEQSLLRLGSWVWLLFVGLSPLGLEREERRRALWILPLFIVLLCGSYYLGRAPLDCPWYLVPITACSLLLGVVGAGEFLLMLKVYCSTFNLPRATAPVALTALVGLYGASTLYEARDITLSHKHSQANEDGLRRRLGEWLRDETPEGAVIAMEAIGYQGYYSRRRVLDLAGLVSPEVVAIYRSSDSNGSAFHRVLCDLRPNYLVLRSFEVDENRHYHGGPLFQTVEHRQQFFQHYREERRFAAPRPELWGPWAHLTVYRRMS